MFKALVEQIDHDEELSLKYLLDLPYKVDDYEVEELALTAPALVKLLKM